MNKKRILILVIIVILVLVGFYLLKGLVEEEKEIPTGEEAPAEEAEEMESELPLEEETEEPVGIAVAPGASPVTPEGEVVTAEGKPVNQAAEPGLPTAPKQSENLRKEEIPAESILLKISASGYYPNEFTVPANLVITLCVTSEDYTHVFKFRDSSLRAVALGVAKGENRCMTFKTPAEVGDYPFYCDVPGHTARGEIGVMHVK